MTDTAEKPTPTRLLRFADLQDRGIVANWVQLRRLIKQLGFPEGFLLGPQTRVYAEADVEAWLAGCRADSAGGFRAQTWAGRLNMVKRAEATAETASDGEAA